MDARSIQIDKNQLRKTLGTFLTGVTIVTTVDNNDRPRGITVNSFASVSLDPALVSFCIDKNARSYATFNGAKHYTINILNSRQKDLALKFATKDQDKFADCDYETNQWGVPKLSSMAAWIDCEQHDIVDAGDHVIIVCRVLDLAYTDKTPLGFYQGQLLNLELGAHFQPHDIQSTNVRIGWIVENYDGRIALQTTPLDGYNIPFQNAGPESLDIESLGRLASKVMGFSVNVKFLYSLFTKENPSQLILIYRAAGDCHDDQRIANDIEFIDPSAFEWSKVPDRVNRVILERYYNERVGDSFGLYTGAERGGTVARLT